MTDDQVRRFNVLQEDIQRGVGVIAEGHGPLNAKIDAVHADLSAKFDGLDAKVTVLSLDGMASRPM